MHSIPEPEELRKRGQQIERAAQRKKTERVAQTPSSKAPSSKVSSSWRLPASVLPTPDDNDEPPCTD